MRPGVPGIRLDHPLQCLTRGLGFTLLDLDQRQVVERRQIVRVELEGPAIGLLGFGCATGKREQIAQIVQ